jgi:hypothetical protein
MIVDLTSEFAKLTMFGGALGRRPLDRQGSVAQLAVYRDGLLLAIKFAGKDDPMTGAHNPSCRSRVIVPTLRSMVAPHSHPNVDIDPSPARRYPRPP